MIKIKRDINKKRVLYDVDIIYKKNASIILNDDFNFKNNIFPIASHSIKCILQPHNIPIDDKINSLLNLYENTNSIMFINNHVMEKDTYSVFVQKFQDDILIKRVSSDGIIYYNNNNNINQKFIDKINNLIQIYSENKFFGELKTINIILSSIVETYKNVGILTKTDVEWINKIYKEYNI